jgi:tetratricopeptide (TPR) repeat protein
MRATHEQAIDLRLALRSALFPSSNFRRIQELLHEAESLAAALDDPRRLGRVSGYMSVHCRFIGAYAQAIDFAQRTVALARASGDHILQALANQYLGAAYLAQGDYPRAIDCCAQTVASLGGAQSRERFGHVTLPSVHSRGWLAACHAELGSFAAGKALAAEGLRIAEAVDHPDSIMGAS